ncbi:MAG: hypothetical protein JRJ12_10150 [Deltaproteobacteria bacterium]|nr:hypothetical protein [Deltaproteobacteria bacterium]MBW2072259.1 hypothetical protein [Deltaproteobacteria bacterium]
MPVIKNLSRARMKLENLSGGTVVMPPYETAEVSNEDLSVPLVKHYLKVGRLAIVPVNPKPLEVTLTGAKEKK